MGNHHRGKILVTPQGNFSRQLGGKQLQCMLLVHFCNTWKKIEQCLQINNKKICECKHSNVYSFLILEILACKLPPMKWPNLYSPMVQTPFQTSFGISWLSVVLYPFDTFSLVSVGLSAMHSSSLFWWRYFKEETDWSISAVSYLGDCFVTATVIREKRCDYFGM